MVTVLQKLLGDPNDKALKKLFPLQDDVNELESEFQKLTDGQLRDKTAGFKSRLAGKETLDDLITEAFAAVRESARRNLGQRPYDVQLIGGMVLHRGQFAEMMTGEG